MQQYLAYLCIDINETGLSLVIFLRVEQFYVVRFFSFFVGYIFSIENVLAATHVYHVSCINTNC